MTSCQRDVKKYNTCSDDKDARQFHLDHYYDYSYIPRPQMRTEWWRSYPSSQTFTSGFVLSFKCRSPRQILSFLSLSSSLLKYSSTFCLTHFTSSSFYAEIIQLASSFLWQRCDALHIVSQLCLYANENTFLLSPLHGEKNHLFVFN